MLMASLILPSNYSVLLFSSRSPSKFPPILLPVVHSRRQHSVVLKEKKSGGGGGVCLGFSGLMETKGLRGCSINLLQRNSLFGSIRRRCNNKGWGSDGEGDFALETEILEFMDSSDNPNKFPTKKDLINAGRVDLVEAIEKNRDWLSKGWDLDEDKEEKEIAQENEIVDFINSGGEVEEDLGSGFLHSDDRIFQERCFNGGECDPLEEGDVGIFASEDSSSSFSSPATPSSSGREMEKEEESVEEDDDDAGINGILKRLEKERNLSFGFGSREQESDISCKNGYEDDDWKLGSSMFSDSKPPASTMSLKHSNNSYIVSEVTDFGKGSISDFDDMGHSLKPDSWRAWSSRRHGLSQLDFEAAEIGLDVVATDTIVVQKNAHETEEESSEYVQTDDWFRSRVRHLESELASTLRSLKSASEIDTSSLKGTDSPSDEFLELSDAWEFKETEVMNAKNKLRSIRAKLAILEGKIALAAIESQKNLEMKQKRINDAQLALNTLRTACIVWPGSKDVVVLVCGSFDGWTSQRMMERTSSGFFVLNLKLYPGRYEFKFIVDGVWKIDPLRPIASNNNGYENNVMVVS